MSSAAYAIIACRRAAVSTNVNTTASCNCKNCSAGWPIYCVNAPPCTCECCKAGYEHFCLRHDLHIFARIHDYGAGDAGNHKLEMLMQRLLYADILICSCKLSDHYDTFKFNFGSEADHDAIKKEFIWHYEEESMLPECDPALDGTCEYPDGIDAAAYNRCLNSYDYGAAMADAQEAYYWDKGIEASKRARAGFW